MIVTNIHITNKSLLHVKELEVGMDVGYLVYLVGLYVAYLTYLGHNLLQNTDFKSLLPVKKPYS